MLAHELAIGLGGRCQRATGPVRKVGEVQLSPGHDFEEDLRIFEPIG